MANVCIVPDTLTTATKVSLNNAKDEDKLMFKLALNTIESGKWVVFHKLWMFFSLDNYHYSRWININLRDTVSLPDNIQFIAL